MFHRLCVGGGLCGTLSGSQLPRFSPPSVGAKNALLLCDVQPEPFCVLGGPSPAMS